MNKTAIVYLSAPADSQRPHRITRHLRQRQILLFASFAVLCLMFSVPVASAQTKARRIRVKPQERARRVENKVNPTASTERRRGQRRSTAPTIRKTVMVSALGTTTRSEMRSSLVNDIVIVSLAEESPITRMPSKTPMGIVNIPSIWPVLGNMRGGFGMRRNPFGGSSSEFHKGQDISAPTGSPVIATADGVVTISGWLRGYGRVVYVDHGNGMSTRYGHLSRADVTVGQTVKRGEQLGLVGSTGRSTGPHLHYEVRIDGAATNPMPYLPATPSARVE